MNIVTRTTLWLLLAVTAARADVGTPQKAINIEDGVVAVRAGVIPNPVAPASLPVGNLKYPTRYFVALANESPYPIWLDAAWTFPGAREGKTSKSKVVKSSKVPSGGSYWFFVDKLSVIVDQPITIDISAWSDEKRTQRIGRQMAEMRFAQPDIDVFLANFPSAFRNQPKGGPAVVISGWRDIPKPRTDVPGTKTDAVLAADIQHALWKFDSARRFTCEREVLGADPILVDDSTAVMRMDEEARDKARIEQDQGLFTVERWHVRSCGQDLVYEVLLSASVKGGTDIMIVDTAQAEGTIEYEYE